MEDAASLERLDRMSSTGPPIYPLPRPPQRVKEVWRLQASDQRVILCVLRDDTEVAPI
jgi:hypothetical protein